MKKILILSIDGGGIRGIIPIKILQYIESITGKRITDTFDLFAGTSTGGLIATGLTVRDPNKSEFPQPLYDLSFLENIYKNRSKEIFPLKHKLQKWYFRRDWSKLVFPRYSERGLSSILHEMFNRQLPNNGQLRINDCIKPILISSYNIIKNEPVFFKTRYALEDGRFNFSLYDVCMATSAAPTYLPPHSIAGKSYQERMLCIDGGIYNNNPTVSALIEVYKHYSYYFGDLYESDVLDPKNVFVLSLGTGRFEKIISEFMAPIMGKISWIKPIIDLTMWGNSQANDYYSKEIFDFNSKDLNAINYLRVNVNIENEKFADMAFSDDVSINYWLDCYMRGFEQNQALKDRLHLFLENAGVEINVNNYVN